MSTMSLALIGLETHARRQLMQNTNTQIPPNYLIELQGFLREYPYDLKFTIRRNHLFGMLTCEEYGCNNVDIPLGNLPGAVPGSIGSLHPYKVHIRTHPSHAMNRNARVREEQLHSAIPQRTGSGNGRLLEALSRNGFQKSQPLAQSMSRYQPSQSSGSVSRRLPGGQVECIELSDSDDSDDDGHKSKRPRLGSVKQPLGTKNPNIPRAAPALQLTPQAPPSQPKQQYVASAAFVPPPGSPSKSKENGVTMPAPSQITTLQQLEVRRKQLDERADRYRGEILMAKGQKGVKARRDADRATNHLQASLAEAARIDRQVTALSRLLPPVAGPSNHVATPRPGPSMQQFVDQLPPAARVPPISTTQRFLDLTVAASLAAQRPIDQIPSATQTFPLPNWQSRLGDLAPASGLGTALVDEDNLADYDDPMQFPRWNQLQRPITGRRVKATMNDIHSFIEMANTNAFGGEKTVQDALQGLELNEVGDCLPGMEVSLLTHQIIGVNWMKMREDEGAKFARGGILADAMGLGKTVQTIGIMCANPSDDPNCKATLIVAPLALLEQWRQEIVDMTEQDSMKILIYHGPSRPKHVKDVKKYDVVLTTYQTLANEWPDELAEVKKKPKKQQNADRSFIVNDDEADGTAPKKKRVYGPLMDMHWYRVVLDEAQNIRNARTRASTAVTHVQSEIRWCLTGTPLTNGLNDAYGLLRFIQHRPFGDWDQFRDMIRGADDDLAAKRVQHALAGVILRRTKESELDGRKLIELPPRQEDWVALEFMEDERAIYSFVEARSQAVFNKFLQAGTVLKNYSQILVMLMRLRQICVHPCLLKVYESAYEVKDTRSTGAKNVLEEAARLVSNEYVVHVKKLLRDAALDRMKLEKEKGDEATIEDNCSICFEPHGEDAVVTAPCAHIYCRGCIEAHIRKPRTEEDARFKAEERDCPLCRQTISALKLFAREPFEPTDEELNISGDAEGFDIDWKIDASTGEGHYKAQAIGKRRHRKNQLDDFSDLDDFIVDDEPTEGRAYKRGRDHKSRSKSRAIIVSDDDDEEEEEEKVEKSDGIYVNGDDSDDFEDIEVVTKKLKGKAKVKGSRKVIDSDSETENATPKRARVNAVDKPTMRSSFLPSTKMQYMMKKLLELAETHPDDKTMVVSQWTSALDLCSDYLNEHNIRHVRFQGSMSVREKNEAIQVFMKKSHIKVMLMSLKAGGVGLNLTRGNRVVSLDLGWSNAVDQQAFDRVHRLGQKKEVFIERLVISDTVEQRVQEIQARKQGLSDGALGEGTGQRMRLSVGELAHLFGLGPAAA